MNQVSIEFLRNWFAYAHQSSKVLGSYPTLANPLCSSQIGANLVLKPEKYFPRLAKKTGKRSHTAYFTVSPCLVVKIFDAYE